MAAHTDDGFHEIQLNGKQLVFLFMAATVVSVVIFLCGVLVGRGVRDQQAATAETVDMSAASMPVGQPATAAGSSAQAGSDPTAAAAPPPVDELSYFDRLQTSSPPAEQLKTPEQLKAQEAKAQALRSEPAKSPAPTNAPERSAVVRTEKPVPAAPVKQAAVSAPARPTPTPAPAVAAAAQPQTASTPAGAVREPQGSGFAVQIAALNVRSEADAIAKRLASKGYAAYVMTPPSGTPQIYRVRIGKFGSRREAETVATKLEKEEQFKPWITR